MMGAMAIAGWTVLAILMVLLMVQMRNSRDFVRPVNRNSITGPPPVSILIPPGDENQALRRCVTSLIAQDYPNLIEILVLDHASNSNTAAIVKPLTIVSDKVRLLEAAPLPDGWTESNWASHQLAVAACGEYLLFTDAMSCHEKDSVSRAVGQAVEEEADLFSLVPRIEMTTTLQRLVAPLANFFYLTFFPPITLWRNRPSVAVNKRFLLFKRKFYDQVGGHESIRGAMAGELALARRISQQEGAVVVADGFALLSARSGMEDFERRMRSFFMRKPLPALAAVLALLLLFVVPPIVLISGGGREFSWVVATIVAFWLRLRSAVRGGEWPLFVLLHPLSIILAAALILKSVRFSRRGSGEASLSPE